MVDIWELTKFVEDHPDNLDQRWRLVKAYYKDKDYRLALEHLLILQNELAEKKNLYRYLAATYYRLTRFEEAEKVVLAALAKWPGELKFQEQHAQILQESGDEEKAADIWESIALEVPKHRFARRAVKQLRKKVAKDYGEKDGGTGAVSPVGVQCPHCGAENEPEFMQCWKCHGGLSLTDSFAPPMKAVAEVKTPFYVPIVKGAIFALLVLSAYLTFKEWSWTTTPANTDLTLTTAYEYYIHRMFSTRMAAGCLLLVLWPFVLRVSVYVTGVDDIDYDWLTICGLFFAALTYASTWLPSAFQWGSLLSFALIPFAVILATYRMPIAQRLVAGVIQFMIVTLLVVTLAGALNGFAIVKDIPKLAALVMTSDEYDPSPLTLEGVTPMVHHGEWDSTGSTWLDSKANVLSFTVTLGPVTNRMFLEVTQGESILSYEEIDGSPFQLNVGPIKPGTPYSVRVFGEDGIAVELSTSGMLPYKGEAAPL